MVDPQVRPQVVIRWPSQEGQHEQPTQTYAAEPRVIDKEDEAA